jgi:phosphatidylglycerophosphate synthase
MVERRSLRSAIKTPDTWWPTLFSGPVANRLVGLVRDLDGVTPNRITAISLAVGLLNGALYAVGTYPSTLLAGLVVQLSFILDCADGQLSRVRATNSLYGFYIDKIADRLKVIAVFFGIAAGVERSSGSFLGWRLAAAYVVCHLVCDLYREAYRALAERVREKPSKQETAPGWLRPFSILDFPFIRFAFGDLFFLLTIASVSNQLVPFLAFEAMMALLQAILRPIYLILHFRRTMGVYPWAVSAPGPLR